MIDTGKLSVTDQWTDGVGEVCRTRQNVSLWSIFIKQANMPAKEMLMRAAIRRHGVKGYV